jgi:hypothetical protein
MSLFDKMKDASEKAGKSLKSEYIKQQDKRAETADARGKKYSVLSAVYLGGYNDFKKSSGTLKLFEKRIEFGSPMMSSRSFSISREDIAELAVEGKDEVNRRVTVTRLLAIGIFAFAMKKKKEDKESYITVVLNDGQEVVFQINDKSPLELKSKLASATSIYKSNSKPVLASSSSNADELIKLVELKEKGIITQAEFDNQKKKILT